MAEDFTITLSSFCVCSLVLTFERKNLSSSSWNSACDFTHSLLFSSYVMRNAFHSFVLSVSYNVKKKSDFQCCQIMTDISVIYIYIYIYLVLYLIKLASRKLGTQLKILENFFVYKAKIKIHKSINTVVNIIFQLVSNGVLTSSIL